MAITAEKVFNIISGRKPEGITDTSVKPFSSLSEDDKQWWERKAQVLQQLIEEDNGSN